jgi:hypothetical protein
MVGLQPGQRIAIIGVVLLSTSCRCGGNLSEAPAGGEKTREDVVAGVQEQTLHSEESIPQEKPDVAERSCTPPTMVCLVRGDAKTYLILAELLDVKGMCYPSKCWAEKNDAEWPVPPNPTPKDIEPLLESLSAAPPGIHLRIMYHPEVSASVVDLVRGELESKGYEVTVHAGE